MRHFIGPILSAAILVVCLPAAASTQIGASEEVAFHSPYLYWDLNDSLALVLRGRVYEPERSSIVRRATIDRLFAPILFRYIGKRPDEFDEDARSLMYERLGLFLADGESRVSLRARIRGEGGEAMLRLPKTNSGGTFLLTVRAVSNLTLAELVGGGDSLRVEIVLDSRDVRRFNTVIPVPPRRLTLLLISDLDDTIRIADVLNRPALIERTFLEPYEPVPGMAAIYRALARGGALFHYLSASPWQLRPVLHQFLEDNEFPSGVLHCRQIGWDFWNSNPLDVREYKLAAIAELLDRFPSGKILLVGDTGEQDPEVYTQVCRKHADRVAGVWIRRVEGPWKDARLEEAARLVGADRVVLFEAAEELEPAVERVTSQVQPVP